MDEADSWMRPVLRVFRLGRQAVELGLKIIKV